MKRWGTCDSQGTYRSDPDRPGLGSIPEELQCTRGGLSSRWRQVRKIQLCRFGEAQLGQCMCDQQGRRSIGERWTESSSSP